MNEKPKKRKKTDALQLCRMGIQVFFFFTAPGVFASVFGAVKTICSRVGAGEALPMTAGMQGAAAIFLYTLLMGRFFCGSACAFGTLGDAVYGAARYTAKRMKKTMPVMPDLLHRRLRGLRYGLLIVLGAICACGGQEMIHGRSPWDAFAQLISGAPVFEGYEIGYAALAVLLIGMALVPRFFCRYLCPLGALFALLPPPLLLRLNKKRAAHGGYRACGACRACTSACPAGLKLKETDRVNSGDCLRCGRCASVCPQGKPTERLTGIPMKPIVLLMMRAALLGGLLYALGMTR